ncbi:hypothetical protein [Natrarchaeobius chitinivorans]|uniref:hypothetical protein n=1 Tax=Natrarchaeobius chitinivorans TaxID=1679083 RepID=UPI001404C22C|nr:hypothetical protein [Natrarchaeobius chitinivorans]
MGVYADDVNEFTCTDDEDDDRPPLGKRLRGLASELAVDSAVEVRELRERS